MPLLPFSMLIIAPFIYDTGYFPFMPFFDAADAIIDIIFIDIFIIITPLLKHY
jgi:hypothetical protein